MKIKIQGLGTPRMEIEVNPDDKISDLKKKIEDLLGADDCPAATQILVNRGRFLKCEHSTLRELNVVEDGKIGVIGPPRMRILPPKQVWTCAAGSSSPAPVAPVISSSVPKPPKLNARKADLNFVARASLSMCKDPRLGIKVYTRKKNLNGRLVNTKSIVK